MVSCALVKSGIFLSTGTIWRGGEVVVFGWDRSDPSRTFWTRRLTLSSKDLFALKPDLLCWDHLKDKSMM